ncbi:MAG: hypothetical protein QF662_02160, partial [Phycisphaerae bacterium]|nr:hypothetical protein [Phycisphaerae bacterium]
MAENEPEAGQIHPLRSLRVNSLWSMAGMGVYGLCQMGIIVVVNQLFKKQGPVEVERYVLG